MVHVRTGYNFFVKLVLYTIICLIISLLSFLKLATSTEINVTLVAGHPPVLRWVAQLNEAFIPAVNKALAQTEHQIDWSPQFSGSLASVGQELEAVSAGLAEIGLILSVFDPAKLANQNVSYYTPFSSVKLSEVLDTLEKLHGSNANFKNTWTKNGLTYLGGGVGLADYILMTKTPVAALTDLKGLKIGVAGPSATWLSETGAVPVSGNLTTYFTNLKSGLLDGVIVPLSAALPTKLYEVAPYILKAGFGAQYAGGMAANAEWYSKQPVEIQKALIDASAVYSKAYADELMANTTNALEEMARRGAMISDIDPEVRHKWANGMDNVAAKWAAGLKVDGSDGAQVLSDYMSSLRAAGAIPLRNWDQE